MQESLKSPKPAFSDILQQGQPSARSQVVSVQATEGHSIQDTAVLHLHAEQPTAHRKEDSSEIEASFGLLVCIMKPRHMASSVIGSYSPVLVDNPGQQHDLYALGPLGTSWPTLLKRSFYWVEPRASCMLGSQSFSSRAACPVCSVDYYYDS